MDSLAREGAGLKKTRRAQQRIAGLESITGMWGEYGALKTDSEGIGVVFARFYEDLYKECVEDEADPEAIPNSRFEEEVTVEEVTAAVKRLRIRKTGADNGLVSEMLQTGHEGLLNAMVMFFTELLRNRL